jgi:hypothetical protein
MPRTLILLAALLTIACTHGPRMDRLSFPTRPEGDQTVVVTGGGRYAGELVTAADTGYVVLVSDSQRAVFISATAVRTIRLASLGQFPTPVRESQLRRLRLVSRHPYGMPDAARTALLALTGQSDFDRIDQ